MKRFIVDIVIFSIILYVVTLCLDKVVSTGLRRSETTLFYNLTKINQGKLNADLIVNGSSKALVQVDPFIIDSILGINSYNLALDGTPFIPQKAQYEFYRLKNTKPKIIIQIVSNGTLRSLNKGFKNSIKFAPYLNIPEVKELMKLTGSFNCLDYSVPMVKYSGKPFEIITGMLSFLNVQIFKVQDSRGYFPKDKSWPTNANEGIESSLKENGMTDFDYTQLVQEFTSSDSVSVQNFERFLAKCETEEIIVFLVYPPIHAEGFNTILNVDYYNRIAHKYNACFLDYSRDSLLVFNKKYFYNSQHLNVDGATIFTKKLAEDINARINNDLNN
ncbi:hypothetical protein [Marinilabilia salmonicolor]|uniref:hypothetical protein n=1 Tax=Marinilabilia salmonicolor TaxID=989 RepID=UPI0002E598BB|nr:hypothetical protein [Marinilabilia salmonicolor]